MYEVAATVKQLDCNCFTDNDPDMRNACKLPQSTSGPVLLQQDPFNSCPVPAPTVPRALLLTHCVPFSLQH